MKTTARFAVLLGVIAAAFFAVLLASSVVHAQHTGTGMVLPSSGGGLDTAAGDARYLMLDASNDPLTGDLSITGNVLPGTDANLDLGSSTLSWDQLYVRYLMDQAGATRIDMPETDTMVFTSTESVTVGQDIGYRFDLTNNLSGVNDIHTVWYDSTPTALLTLMEDGELRFGWHGNVSTPNITSGSGYGIYFTNASVGISASGTETAALFTTSGIELSAVGPDFIWTASSSNNSAGNIAVFTAANASGEISVTTGTSNNTAVGVKLEKWCLDCDSAATEIGYITDGGDLQIDGEFLASAGSVGTPSISFLLDPDTGIYSAGADQVGVAVGGTNVGTFTSAGLTLPASTATADPFLNFSGAGTNSGVAYYDSGAQKVIYLRLNGSTVFSSSTTAYTQIPSYYVMPTAAWGIYGNGSMQALSTTSSFRIYSDYAGANLNYIATNADGTGDTALAVGSRAVAGGQTMFAVCADCDGTPSYLMKVESAGEARFSAGTAASPVLSFLLDADTGIYNSAANTLDFAAGGVRHGYVDANGITSVLASGGGFHGFVSSHAGSGTDQYTGFSANTNATNYTEVYATGSTYTATGPAPQNGGVLTNNGSGGLNIASTHATTPAIRFMLDTPTTTIATIESTGLLPGADNSFNLGSSTLSWADFFTKYISDQAGANRITLNEASYTTFATGQAATAGADVAYYFDVAGNYDNADSHTRWRDNGTTLLMELTGTGTLELGSGSASAPIFAYASDDRTGMFFPSTSAVAFSQQGVEMARFDSTGLLLDATGPNYLRTAASSSGALGIFSGADASAEVAVHIGTSDATGSGEYLASFCLDCDGTPVEVARVESDGDAQFDGVVQGDGGIKVGSTGSTITESVTVSTGSVDFASITADTCGEKTLTLTGADVNTPVACSWPAALEANLVGMCFVSAADTITFRLCNPTGVAIDPAAATFGARTIK